jgi:hypothetical protein
VELPKKGKIEIDNVPYMIETPLKIDKSNELSKKLIDLYEKKAYSDFKITIINNKEEKCYSIHKFIIGGLSKKFQKICSEKDEIKIDNEEYDFNMDYFDNMMEYLYTRQVSLSDRNINGFLSIIEFLGILIF